MRCQSLPLEQHGLLLLLPPPPASVSQKTAAWLPRINAVKMLTWRVLCVCTSIMTSANRSVIMTVVYIFFPIGWKIKVRVGAYIRYLALIEYLRSRN